MNYFFLIVGCVQIFSFLHAQINFSDQEVITNQEEKDGFGSQFQNIIATVIYAELTNKKYVYTPFKTMEHNYNQETDFIEKKEWLINFIGNFELNENNNAYPQEGCKHFFDMHITECASSLSLKKIKKIFRENKPTDNYFNNNCLNIAIHIRRPNSHDSRIEGTDIPDDIFLKIINELRIKYAAQKPLFHIYSQGSVENYRIFEEAFVVLHINESLEDSFIGMVFADILVMSASSFSYTAGLLSNGVVYYFPFWHAPLPHWIIVDKINI